jgi:hypothetical protein
VALVANTPRRHFPVATTAQIRTILHRGHVPARSGLARATASCEARGMVHEAVDITEKLSLVSEHWSPKVVARLNDYEIKVVKVKGEFLWHTHDDR